MYWEQIKVIISQADPYDKTRDAIVKGVGVAKFYFTKTFRNQLFSRVRVLHHQYSITNHSKSISKSKLITILMIVIVVFLSDLLRNILKCNSSMTSPPCFSFSRFIVEQCLLKKTSI